MIIVFDGCSSSFDRKECDQTTTGFFDRRQRGGVGGGWL